MDNMEYIDDYFKGSPTDQQKELFEQRIINDISFAEDVAFYVSANSVLKEQLQEQKKLRFKEIYEQQKVVAIAKRPVVKMVRYLAAASLVTAVIFLTWLLTGKNSSPQQLAGQYIQQNFQKLPVTMGDQDSLQMGLSLFNDHKLTEALNLFETILKNDPTNSEARKYAGIASLRLADYNKALFYFKQLEASKLYNNPGKFYQAVTLLQRNNTGDQAAAKILLQDVKGGDLEEKETAAEWLQKISP